MLSKHPIWTALAVWLGPVVAIALALWLVPNTTLRTAAVGSFVSAEPLKGGNYWGNPAATVQTTRGMFVANGIFSALRGEPLVIRDTSKHGLMVCTASAVTTCAELTGDFVGAFTPVPGARAWVPRWVWASLEPIAWTWGLLAGIWFLLVLAGILGGGESDGRR